MKSSKKKLKMNLPIQIGFFVYQYAKLRMLQFYYNCVDHFLDRSNYELLEMDTDSLYMALAGDSVEELVKPKRKRSFKRSSQAGFLAEIPQKTPHTTSGPRVSSRWSGVVTDLSV